MVFDNYRVSAFSGEGIHKVSNKENEIIDMKNILELYYWSHLE